MSRPQGKNIRLRMAWATALLVALLGAHLLLQARPSSEAVRLRNALLIVPASSSLIDWVPPNYPADFKRETLPPDPRFLEIVRRIGADQGDDLQRALRIAGHLTESAKDLGPIQSDTWTAYQQIRQGRGYCSDFTQTFLALAHAADLPVREWGFSFDGFGGKGHAVVEIYDRQLQQWVFLDVFNNFHVRDASNRPLSAAEWRQVIIHKKRGLSIHPNGPGRPGFALEPVMRNYYERGIHGWFLLLGTNTQSYEAQPLVHLLGGISRYLEQTLAILTGVHPRISILETQENRPAVDKMHRLRTRLLIELPLLVISALSSLLFFVSAWRTAKKQAIVDRSGAFPIVMLIGPLPPPSGGMANQCEQLRDLLHKEGVRVNFVQTNAPYRPAWVSLMPSVRAVFRFIPYLLRVWATLGGSHVAHLFANSGKAWYLFCLPVLVFAKLRGVPCIVNYRGGEADIFFRSAPAWVGRSLALASTIVAPSAYLAGVFRALGFTVRIIPNIINLERFSPSERKPGGKNVHLIVTRNLEPIYDIPTALRTLAKVIERHPDARLTIAGSGQEEARLKELATNLGIADAVDFAGRIPNQEIPSLYASADVVLNPSTVDNMPISILESFASGVPVVSTNAGGIPFIAKDGENALLVTVGDADAMAAAVLTVLDNKELAAKFRANGLIAAQAYTWSAIRELWLDTYRLSAQWQELSGHA